MISNGSNLFGKFMNWIANCTGTEAEGWGWGGKHLRIYFRLQEPGLLCHCTRDSVLHVHEYIVRFICLLAGCLNNVPSEHIHSAQTEVN